MSDFARAWNRLARHEGLYTVDQGGPTNYGLTIGFLRGLPDLDGDGFADGDINRDHVINIDDVKALDIRRAEEIFREHFWNAYRYHRLESQAIASHALDFGVNFGPARGCKILQMGLRACGCAEIRVDGKLGPFTLLELNRQPVPVLDAAIRASAAGAYRTVAAHDPAKHGGSLGGWLNRAYDPWHPGDL